MKSSIAIMTMLMAGSGAAAWARQNTGATRVVVYVKLGTVSVPQTEMEVASTQASFLFKAAGVRLEWRSGEPKPDKDGARVVGIRFVETAPPEYCDRQHHSAMAFALPFATNLSAITVIGDRVTRLLTSFEVRPAGQILGHILAHEIAHVLEGFSHHSTTGLMKAYWTANDYSMMTRGALEFAPQDLELLAEGLRPTVAVSAAGPAMESR